MQWHSRWAVFFSSFGMAAGHGHGISLRQPVSQPQSNSFSLSIGRPLIQFCNQHIYIYTIQLDTVMLYAETVGSGRIKMFVAILRSMHRRTEGWRTSAEWYGNLGATADLSWHITFKIYRRTSEMICLQFKDLLRLNIFGGELSETRVYLNASWRSLLEMTI